MILSSSSTLIVLSSFDFVVWLLVLQFGVLRCHQSNNFKRKLLPIDSNGDICDGWADESDTNLDVLSSIWLSIINAIFESVKQGRQHSFLNLKVTKNYNASKSFKRKNENEKWNFLFSKTFSVSAFSNFLKRFHLNQPQPEKCSWM